MNKNYFQEKLDELNNLNQTITTEQLVIKGSGNECLYADTIADIDLVLRLPQKICLQAFDKNWAEDPESVINKYLIAILFNNGIQTAANALAKYPNVVVGSIRLEYITININDKAKVGGKFIVGKKEYMFELATIAISDGGALINLDRLDCTMDVTGPYVYSSRDCTLAGANMSLFREILDEALNG